MELKLVLPNRKYLNQVQDYKDEMLACNSSMDGCGTLNEDTVQDWFKKCKDHRIGKNLPSGFVSATQYLCIRKDDDKLVGMLQIRHELNDFLLNYGGHVGDSVLPSERNKGYGKKVISLGLKKCKELGINKVLVTCKDTNVASRKCIVAVGGVYEDSRPYKDGVSLERYWISI